MFRHASLTNFLKSTELVLPFLFQFVMLHLENHRTTERSYSLAQVTFGRSLNFVVTEDLASPAKEEVLSLARTLS